ncbi:hypothetical protein BOTBODRAFT_252022 [Botryobasidium botryosum FD-172 SS1]|uniref:Uncharacterized protein n=1 Tax=Botryobasidium botryosum (strain FD-172 SS1) TaxID=930990 RepID=A0A067MLX0_BOTB1|nr:hypothetical protein BOTBODRAFT_252022 [Botryobasidium botryosum FD-172 SS1]
MTGLCTTTIPCARAARLTKERRNGSSPQLPIICTWYLQTGGSRSHVEPSAVGFAVSRPAHRLAKHPLYAGPRFVYAHHLRC